MKTGRDHRLQTSDWAGRKGRRPERIGHSTIVGVLKREWQDTREILKYFGGGRGIAVRRYVSFVEEGIIKGRRAEFVGGGLLRSVGGWSEVVSMRRRGAGMVSDARILGAGGFVERVIAEAEAKERETLRLRQRVQDQGWLLREVTEKKGVKEEDLRGPRRRREAVGVVKLFCQLAVRRYGYTGATGSPMPVLPVFLQHQGLFPLDGLKNRVFPENKYGLYRICISLRCWYKG